MRRKCSNHPDQFCFVCRKFINKEKKWSSTHDIKKMYVIYFGYPLDDQDKFHPFEVSPLPLMTASKAGYAVLIMAFPRDWSWLPSYLTSIRTIFLP